MLMEEDMEDKTHMLQESLELQAKGDHFMRPLARSIRLHLSRTCPLLTRTVRYRMTITQEVCIVLQVMSLTVVVT
uniref:Putative ovule protein n=1 Tax=Solanum chacoense TaxID=4108 RepID=A0A0V0GU49_SOLCH